MEGITSNSAPAERIYEHMPGPRDSPQLIQDCFTVQLDLSPSDLLNKALTYIVSRRNAIFMPDLWTCIDWVHHNATAENVSTGARHLKAINEHRKTIDRYQRGIHASMLPAADE